MGELLWARRPRPEPGPGATVVGRWAPAAIADLSAHRRELAATLDDGARPAGAGEDAVQRLLLAFEELVSNGLRHGRAPVEVVVTATGTGWLLEVSDAAGELPPVVAVDRDAEFGGLGLYLVAELSGEHGWARAKGGRKLTWCRVDAVRESTPDVARLVPRPRRESGGHSQRR